MCRPVGGTVRVSKARGEFFGGDAKMADISPFLVVPSPFLDRDDQKRSVGVIDKAAQFCFTRALSFIKLWQDNVGILGRLVQLVKKSFVSSTSASFPLRSWLLASARSAGKEQSFGSNSWTIQEATPEFKGLDFCILAQEAISRGYLLSRPLSVVAWWWTTALPSAKIQMCRSSSLRLIRT